MPLRKPYASAALLWILMVAVFFAPVLFQGKVLAPLDILDSLLRPWADGGKIEVHNAFTYDAISQYLPYDWSVFQSLKQDGYVGWNPNTHSGAPIIANTMVCPGDWHHQLYRVLPFWSAWNLGIIFQFALAGLGMLVLLRSQKIPAAHALVGVIAFGFYSQFTVWIYHRWVLGAMCWAPWIVWSLLRARKHGRIIDLPSVVFIALGFRGGHLQTCIFVVLLVLIVAVAEWWQSPARRDLRKLPELLLPFAVCGLLGTILAADILVETVPALLHGKREMASRGWLDTVLALPTLATSLFPTIMGTPQGLDAMKLFRVDLFTIKFMGAVALLAAAYGLFNRNAPLAAKLLFIAGIAVPFTPADEWLYSRFTVVFGLGGAWLAAWQLHQSSQSPPTRFWNRCLIALGCVTLLWLLGSALISFKYEWIQERLHQYVLANLPAGKAQRTDWMLGRADVFLTGSLIWNPRNLASLTLIATGMFACSRIRHKQPKNEILALVVAACTFGEMLMFSSTWITTSNKPRGPHVYETPEWIGDLKQHLGNGTIACIDRSDFDYMQLNTPSSYGIRFAEGYDTVTPKHVSVPPTAEPDPLLFAQAGISHLLVPPDSPRQAIAGWEKVHDSPQFRLFSNPAFESIYLAHLADGTSIPLQVVSESPNVRKLLVPANTRSLTWMESFNPGWTCSIAGQSPCKVEENKLHGMSIYLPEVELPTEMIMRYRPAHQSMCHTAMGLTAAGLIGFSFFQSRRAKARQSA